MVLWRRGGICPCNLWTLVVMVGCALACSSGGKGSTLNEPGTTSGGVGTTGMIQITTGGGSGGSTGTEGATTTTNTTASGGTGGGSSLECASGEVECNGVCLSAEAPSGNGCHLLLASDAGSQDPVFDLEADGGELFVARGTGVYRVDPEIGTWQLLGDMPDGRPDQLVVVGDAIYVAVHGTPQSVQRMPRTGGEPTLLASPFSDITDFAVGASQVCFGDGVNLECVPREGGDAVVMEFDVDAIAMSGDDIFFAGLAPFEGFQLNHGVLPLPLATPPTLLAEDLPAYELVLDESDVYAFNNDGQFRVPRTGGAPELVSDTWSYVYGQEVFFVENGTLWSRPLAGGDATAIGELSGSGGWYFAADSAYAYLADTTSVVAMSR